MKTIIQNLITDQINKESDYINEHEEIANILKPLEGQIISGKVLNKKKLGKFSFKSQYGMFYIIGKYEHLIGYDSEPIISLGKIEDTTRGFYYFDCCHGQAARDRIKQLENINVDLLNTIFSEVKENFNNICILFGDVERNNLGSFYNPIYYRILEAIKPNTDKHSDIKLSDFYYIKK